MGNLGKLSRSFVRSYRIKSVVDELLRPLLEAQLLQERSDLGHSAAEGAEVDAAKFELISIPGSGSALGWDF